MSSTKFEARIQFEGGRLSVDAGALVPRLASRLGFWAALLVTAIGVVYLVGLIVGSLLWGLTMPPAEPLQLLGAVTTLLLAPTLVVLMACVHDRSPAERKVFSLLGLVFTALFAGMVSINRFVQLAVVRQSVLSGQTEGLARFMPYGDGSVMFALELLGWGFFLGLAALFVAWVFGPGRLERWIRWLFVSYGVIGLLCAIGFVLAIPFLSTVGFLAWGVVLPVTTALLAVLFRRVDRMSS